MPPDRPSLRARISAAGDPSGRWVAGMGRELRLDRLLRASILGPDRDQLAGRRVLLATADHFLTAVALVELDGIAARLILCPSDVRAEDFGALIRLGEVDAVVTDRPELPVHLAPDLPVTRPAWPATEASDPEAGVADTEWVLLTSGTTGTPKLVVHSLGSLTHPLSAGPPAQSAAVWATFYDIRRYGGLQMFLRGVLGGGSLALPGPGEPVADFLDRLAPLGVTHLAGTPSHWRRALMGPALRRLAPGYVRLSGEIADQAVLDALRSAFPAARIGHAFATTEAGVAFEVNDAREGFPASLIGRHPNGVELSVSEGALRIRSPRVARRLLGTDDPVTAPDGFVDTGDIVERDGDRFRFAGRRGGVINVGGLKVYPEEVEAVLNRHPGVRMSVVEARKSPITGALVTARIVRSAGPGEVTTDESLRRDVLAFCGTLLPRHKVPALLSIVDAIPVTEAGKITRSHG